jgi:adenosine deaminase
VTNYEVVLNKLFGFGVSDVDVYHALPKVELHRHLEGSLRVQTLIEIAHAHSLTLPMGIMRLNRLVQVQEEEPFTFENFLAKFNVLRLFYRSPDVIHRITREAVEDAAKDNIKHIELRFTPVALSRAERFPLNEVVDWVCTSAKEAARKHGITVRLIASVNRHESPELAEQVSWIAANYMEQGIAGLDLAGNEAQFPAAPFIGIFKEAKQAGLFLTVHAGEWGGAQNVRQAIEEFGADRIGHGVRVLEDEYTTTLAREHKTAFEVCLTSNYQTGVVTALNTHPIKKMIDKGLNVTINTDDPSISQITLSNEYRIAAEQLKLPMDVLKQRVLASAQATFQSEAERIKLADILRKQLK